MVIALTPSPTAHLAGPPRRETHGAKLYWTDVANGGATKTYIAVDVIPSFEATMSSTVTQFPVQDGTVFSDHILHFPDQLKLEIAQTNEPFEDMDKDGKWSQFPYTDATLEMPQTSFRARGLLFLSLVAEGLVGMAVTGALTAVGLGAQSKALGLGQQTTGGTMQVALQKNPNVRDRVNELLDALNTARLNARLVTLEWLGKVWTNLAIENINYSRKKGSSKGEFSVTVTQVNTTLTATTDLPSPADMRLKSESQGGQKPGVETKSKAEQEADEESVLHAIIF